MYREFETTEAPLAVLIENDRIGSDVTVDLIGLHPIITNRTTH